jgi:hypothetical protein
MVLSVDSVTDVVVVGNSGVRIGEGPSKNGGASRSERNSVGRTAGLPGNGTSIAILVVETDEISSMSEGDRGLGIGSTGMTGSGARGMTWTIGGGTNPSTGWVMTRLTGLGSAT